jgi:hypothetical protein
MRRDRIKKEIIEILKQGDENEIFISLQRFNEHHLLNSLFSGLCHPEEIVRWHAVSAFGEIVDCIARKGLESARIVMRRFLWSLNDESGGIGWGAPEAMSEIMFRNEIMYREYVHMLLSYMREDGPGLFQDGNYLELPQLQRGVVWGIGRLAGKYRENLVEHGAVGDLLPYLSSPDGQVRGIAACALGTLMAGSARDRMQCLLTDSGYVSLYLHGAVVETTVSELVRKALDDMDVA